MRTSPSTRTALSVRALAVSALMALALGGCAERSATGAAPESPTTRFPIEVGQETVSVVVKVPTALGQAPDKADSRRLRHFINDYISRGRSAIIVETQMTDATRRFLEAQGLRADELHMVADTSLKAPNAALSFTANVANVPECGDWSRSTAFAPDNRTSSNFGCANRRNMGLTVADPGDLIHSKPKSPSPAARRDSTMDGFNTGQPINPALQSLDPGAISSGDGN